ncbi:sulfite exporter TauE/SafE family protein [Balneola sp. MJW-20]|uniref:sulfite exporter TauE/SafE family protein n=1 Tax=Gracilimonas aurantiaca TaxID=3234185 RepID=UPI0034669EEB
MPVEILLPVLFFLVALCYSSVGFGGGSSYLAILGIFLTDFHEIRSTALILNLTVVSVGTIMYMRNRVFDWRAFWPFLVSSIPMAYLGAQLRLTEQVFFMILGSLLLLAGVALIYKFMKTQYEHREFSTSRRLGLGGAIGLFAGVSGIGGGIYLSPILNMLGWKDARKIASLASIFILVNSAAGLTGLLVSGTFSYDPDLLLTLVIGVFGGGLLGSYLSNSKFNTRILGLLTAVLVIYVGLRLILLHSLGIKI